MDRTARPAHADLPANEGATSYHGGNMALDRGRERRGEKEEEEGREKGTERGEAKEDEWDG